MRDILAETPDGTLVICPADYDPAEITDEDILHDGAITAIRLDEGEELGPDDWRRSAICAPAAAGRGLIYRDQTNGHATFRIWGLSDIVFEPVYRRPLSRSILKQMR